MNGGELPKTIVDSYFNPMRLLMLQSRRSAAYKGIVALIMKNHSRDFISGQEMDLVLYKTAGIDIHHIFPKNYCKNLVEEQEYFILPNELFANVRKAAPTNENLNETLEGVELDMNKVLSITMIVASMLIFVPKCDATDVWVEHWNNENIDVFIMDDTIVSYRGARSIGFTVSTKLVKNGTLQRVTNWTFDSLKGWKYSTNDGQHFNSPAIFKNNIFEFCMNQLGWIYSIRDDGSYY